MNHETPFDLLNEHRAFLTALAHRITGNWADAEDLVSQASHRAEKLDFSAVQNPRAFLATMVTNIAINHVNSARVRREVVLAPEQISPMQEITDHSSEDLSDALRNALDLVLSRLSPTERTVFLLREVFQFDYDEIADLLTENEANCRQLLRRAREKLSLREPRFHVQTEQRELALERLLAASRDGNVDELIAAVAPGVVLVRDPSDIGLPQPPPITTRESVLEHIRACINTQRGDTWTCYRVSDRYEIAMLQRPNRRNVALIAALENGAIQHFDQISCPKRLHTLKRLFGLGNRP
ncbi:MAG TPA: sigma-70 family RNA polymerase sigma factor [Verrucomicrobiae bacterium]|nr:sigma-70 family RNA polymerase sigma factor [Verrucomicrobiae bacterium]